MRYFLSTLYSILPRIPIAPYSCPVASRLSVTCLLRRIFLLSTLTKKYKTLGPTSVLTPGKILCVPSLDCLVFVPSEGFQEPLYFAMLLLQSSRSLPQRTHGTRHSPVFEHRQPGHILFIRQAPGNLITIVSNTSAALHTLFRTTNVRNELPWAVTTLFLPRRFYATPSGHAALLSFQLADHSANHDNAPSLISTGDCLSIILCLTCEQIPYSSANFFHKSGLSTCQVNQGPMPLLE